LTTDGPTARFSRPRAARLVAASLALLAGPIAIVSTGGASAARAQTVSSADKVIARIAAGGTVKDSTGHKWVSDASVAKGGKVWRSKTAIPRTTNDALYQGERYGSFAYGIKVPTAGVYRVQVNETETTFTRRGQRVFSIKAEGSTKASRIDIIKRTGARYAPLTITFNVTVKDGMLNLQFLSQTNEARVSSVMVTRTKNSGPTVVPVPAPTPSKGSPAPGSGTTSGAAPAIAAPTSGPTALFGSPFTGDPTMPVAGFFGSGSVFKQSLSSAPAASNSAALVSTLVSQVQQFYGGIAAFNVWQYNTSNYTVGSTQALIDLKWDDCQHKGYVPSTLFGPGGFMVHVPMPSNAAPSVGSDASIGIYQPSSDTYWGFWKLNRQADGWHACWGGKIDHVSQTRGWYPNGEGVSATGLADGGSIGIKEAQAGHIDHAIAVGIPSPADWRRFSWPALRADGADYTANAIPEGTRFRLDASLNVDALPLSPLGKMVAKAAQKYGFIVTDAAGCVSISTESGAAVNSITGVNPWNALLAGTPSYLVMKNFPWDKLQAMPLDYGKS
jgi:hypothetical protein